jgi:hypothetical protein
VFPLRLAKVHDFDQSKVNYVNANGSVRARRRERKVAPGFRDDRHIVFLSFSGLIAGLDLKFDLQIQYRPTIGIE